MTQINYVQGDDWCGLYIDGKLVHEGHSIDVTQILSILDIAHHITYVNDDWMYSRGRLPENFGWVVSEHEEWSPDDANP